MPRAFSAVAHGVSPRNLKSLMSLRYAFDNITALLTPRDDEMRLHPLTL